MAHHSHVPKFGNWDGNDNVPYTTYFENARKEKDTSGKRINPNDPEENPNLFTYGLMGHEQLGNHHVIEAPPSEMRVEKRKEEYHGKEEGSVHYQSSFQKSKLNRQKSGNRRTTPHESSTDRSSSDRSLIQQNNHRSSSSKHKKSVGEVSNSFPTSSVRSVGHRSNEIQPQPRVASVPKFGAWDETDPTSGEGFTVIFNKVKQEKQIGVSKTPTISPERNVHPNGQRNNGNSSSKPKRCCYLF